MAENLQIEEAHIYVHRTLYDKQTQGIFFLNGIRFHTIEPTWLDNKKYISCVPDGTYLLTHHNSPKYGHCLKLHDVPNRTDVLIHYGNYYTNTQGCILVGDSFVDINKDGIIDITNSRATCKLLYSMLAPYTQHKITLDTTQDNRVLH